MVVLQCVVCGVRPEPFRISQQGGKTRSPYTSIGIRSIMDQVVVSTFGALAVG